MRAVAKKAQIAPVVKEPDCSKLTRRIRAGRPEWERFYSQTLPGDVAMWDFADSPPRDYESAPKDSIDMLETPLDRIWRIADGLMERMARLDPHTGNPREVKK